ncbi:RHS repeat-associated core domain-containing protein [Chryseobacterium sp. PTM-20240506]|uniref:RHS repeat-associated core domain-containing protein n=2 Tax=unclassified Chryseobacterium TaxID=2593645 RepID=UPI003AAC9099
MKFLYSFIISFCSLLGFSQTILYQQENASRTVQDPQAILLAQGFKAAADTSNPFVAQIGPATENPGGGPTDSNAGATNPYGTTAPEGQSFHDTKGNIEVSESGQLQFTLPIALPPGIKSVAPQANLIYSSGSGNGIAGYGWSLSGITSISRTGRNMEKDGEIKGVQLDESDYYSYNGQRLILKSGEYGKDGSEYVTEKYSNIKVKSIGTITGQAWKGPLYWVITFEDGSQAWYGATTSGNSPARTPVDYNIVKWKDAQGNYISYQYTQSNNVAIISNIQWGGNENSNTAHFNTISFNYEARQLTETSYLKTQSFIQSNLLKDITVHTNGLLFKKYKILNELNSDNKYQLVKSITEQNAKQESANPILFTYENATVKDWKESRIYDVNGDNKGINGDFDGDGKVDVLRNEGTNIILYKDVFGNNTKVPVGSLAYMNAQIWSSSTSFTIKNTQNQLLTRQGWVTLEQKTINGTLKKDLIIRGYSVNDDNQLIAEFEKTLSGDKYDYSSSNDYEYAPYPNNPSYTITLNSSLNSTLEASKELDLDGDNQSELILKITDMYCNDEVTNNPDQDQTFPIIDRKCNNNSRTMIVSLYDDMQVSHAGGGTKSLFESLAGDFDGDGVLEFISYNGSIESYKKGQNGFTATIRNISRLEGVFDRAIVGDFNGDGKADLMIPQADKSSHWNLYISNGVGFIKEVKNNLAYFTLNYETSKEGVHNTFFESGCRYATFTGQLFAADDLDGDGRSEFIATTVSFVDHSWNNHFNWENTSVSSKVFTTANSNGVPIVFTQHGPTKNFYFNQVVVPFATTTMYRDGKKVIILGKPQNCGKTDCERFIFLEANGFRDTGTYSRISSIVQGDLSTNIEYKELNPSTNPNLYTSVKKEEYPYIEVNKFSGLYAVSQLLQTTNNGVRKQDFRYRGFVSHLQGRGSIGFRQTARSSWYADGFEATKIWSGVEIDPLNEGVPVKEWSIRTNNENLIFPANISENNTQLLSFKSTIYERQQLVDGQVTTNITEANRHKVVVAIIPTTNKIKDFLTNTLTASTIIYGDYYLPAKRETRINNNFAITTSTFDYFHNPSGTGTNYYIGRPKIKEDVVQAYGDTKRTKEEYTYENNLLKTQITWNRNNTESITETYNYDAFGNITKRAISNSIDSRIQNTESRYDPKGRFVVKKMDNLGLETNIVYNDWGQIEKQTDPLGNTLENKYDGWGKLLTSKTNLNGITSYQYERDSNTNITMTQNDPDGNITKKYTNKQGQEYKTSTKAFGQGQYISKETQYDILGRKIKESEPYFEGQSANQWNSISYDDTVFPAKITATSFNGKKAETSVSGLTTTVKELNGYGRTTTKTTDALGNVISSTDKGGTIQFSYNAAGEQIKAQYAENIVTTKYDPWGRKSEFNDPSNGIYKYEYNGSGQPKKIISPKGTKEYTYNNLGQLISQKEISTMDGGEATNKNITFSYDDKGRVISKSGTSKGQAYNASIIYDPQGRVLFSSESSNGKYFIQKGITYDDKARVISYEKQLYSSGVLTKIQIENFYSNWNGELLQVKDKQTGKTLWQLQETNAKGQVLKAMLGATNINNTYAADGFLSQVNHSSKVKASILQLSYSFDAIKNELKSRTTGGDFNIIESFDYDDNNRLINWTNPVTGVKPSANRNVYDVKGRITQNDQVGTIKFENSQKIYQPTGMTLNTAGTQNYNNDLIQSISYNENNDPVFIDGEKGDVAFQYGLTSMRQRVSYGGNFSNDGEGKFTKFYSEDGSYEVIKDNTTGKEKHILYIGGTPYDSNIVYLKDYTESSGSYKFLHKDYIGSILAISDEAGNKLEQRHFDAWGNFTHLKIGNGAIITDQNVIRNSSLLIERGYTSHEHFTEVGIIHMNGRLYDPLLRRFLNADENIQDPTNTQNYNKYGYVLNNPLMFNDPSGEELVTLLGISMFAIWKAVFIGAAVGLVSYTLTLGLTGNIDKWSFGGALKSMFFGAVGGAATFGIGTIFSAAAKTFGNAVLQAGAHGLSQGVLGMVQNNGSGFLQAFASGALGSLGAAGFQKLVGDAANSTVGTIAFGALAGGIGSELTGGNFWQGAVIGGIVAGLNHAMHRIGTKSIAEKELNAVGVKDVNATAPNTQESLDTVLSTDTLSSMHKKSGNVPIGYGTTDLGNEAETTPNASSRRAVSIVLNKNSTFSYFKLYQTVGHELTHAIDFISGAAVRQYGIYMKRFSNNPERSMERYNNWKEYRAYGWEMRYAKDWWSSQQYNKYKSLLGL